MIGWVIIIAFTVLLTGWFVRLTYDAFTKDKAETLADFRQCPLCAIGALLSMTGVLGFFWQIATMGKLEFHFETPWGRGNSFALSGALAIFGLLLAGIGSHFRRKKRR